MKETYHVNVGEADRIALLLVRFLGLPLRLALEEALLQRYSVLYVLLAQSVETLIEPGDAVGLPAPIAFDSSSQAVHDRLPLRGGHLTHAGCLAHLLLLLLLVLLVLLLLLLLMLLLQVQLLLMLLLAGYAQLTGVQLVDRGLAKDVAGVPVRALARAHGDGAGGDAGGALRGLTGQEPPGLHTAP